MSPTITFNQIILYFSTKHNINYHSDHIKSTHLHILPENIGIDKIYINYEITSYVITIHFFCLFFNEMQYKYTFFLKILLSHLYYIPLDL